MGLSKQTLVLMGLAAGTLTTLSFLPQLARVYRLKSAKDLSYGYLLAFALGILLWLAYGILVRDTPLIIANAVTLSLVMALVGMKIGYGRAQGH